jgi:hypothetical protein
VTSNPLLETAWIPLARLKIALTTIGTLMSVNNVKVESSVIVPPLPAPHRLTNPNPSSKVGHFSMMRFRLAEIISYP